MNAAREKEALIIIDELEKIQKRIDTLYNHERIFYDNMPYELEGSKEWILSEESLEALDETHDLLNDCIESMSNVRASD